MVGAIIVETVSLYRSGGLDRYQIEAIVGRRRHRIRLGIHLQAIHIRRSPSDIWRGVCIPQRICWICITRTVKVIFRAIGQQEAGTLKYGENSPNGSESGELQIVAGVVTSGGRALHRAKPVSVFWA